MERTADDGRAITPIGTPTARRMLALGALVLVLGLLTTGDVFAVLDVDGPDAVDVAIDARAAADPSRAVERPLPREAATVWCATTQPSAKLLGCSGDARGDAYAEFIATVDARMRDAGYRLSDQRVLANGTGSLTYRRR